MHDHDRMRKREREVSDRDFLLSELDDVPYAFLAMADGGRPYVVPVSFVRVDDSIYFHSALVGRKIDFITASPRVAFSVVKRAEYLKGKLDFEYFSICFEGLARIVADRDEKVKAYRALIEKFEGSPEGVLSDECLESSVVVCVDIYKISGKRNSRSESSHDSYLQS